MVDPSVPAKVLSTQQFDTTDDYLQNVVDLVIYIVTVLIPPIFIVLGIIGNFCSFRLMSQKKYEKSTTCFYMRCMAIFDCLYIYGRMFLRYLLVVAPHLFTDKTVQKPFCLYYGASLVFGLFLSPYILVVMAIDRFIALTWPLKATIICTMRRARISAAAIFIFAAILGGAQGMRTYQETRQYWLCPYSFDQTFHDMFATFVLIYMTFIPIILLVFLNFGILLAVQRSRRNKTLRNKTEGASSNSSITLATIIATSTFTFFQLFSDPMNNFFWANWDGDIDADVQMHLKRLTANVGTLGENMNYCFNAYIYILSCKRLRNEMFDIIFPSWIKVRVKS